MMAKRDASFAVLRIAASWTLVAVFGLTLAFAVRSVDIAGADGLGAPVLASLGRVGGVESPVTAVLMSFRAYDTLLELVVLLTAYSGLRARDMPLELASDAVSPVLDILIKLLAPFLVLFAGYLLWAGSSSHGGAFQAGAVLAAAGLLAALSGRRPVVRVGWLAARTAIALGPLVFASVGVAAMLAGGALLEFPPRLSKLLTIVVESAATISIGAALIALFVGRSLLGNAADREAG